MEFAQAVRRRRMVRDYDPDRAVPPEVLTRLVAYAARAPSAGFTQGWNFLVLTDPGDRAAFWAATTPPGAPPSAWLRGMSRAPALIVPHTSRDAYLDRYAQPDKGWTDRDPDRWPVPYWYVDCAFATMSVLLGVVDEGLGACFFGIPAQRLAAYRAAFEVPAGQQPIGVVSVGYPAAGQRSRPLGGQRRDVTTVTHLGRWGRHDGGDPVVAG